MMPARLGRVLNEYCMDSSLIATSTSYTLAA